MRTSQPVTSRSTPPSQYDACHAVFLSFFICMPIPAARVTIQQVSTTIWSVCKSGVQNAPSSQYQSCGTLRAAPLNLNPLHSRVTASCIMRNWNFERVGDCEQP